MAESDFQASVIKKIYKRIPGCVIMKNDAQYRQGFPDLTIYHRSEYAILEFKADSNSDYQPNQEDYLRAFGRYTFAKRISPENEEEVLNGLCQFFGIQ